MNTQQIHELMQLELETIEVMLTNRSTESRIAFGEFEGLTVTDQRLKMLPEHFKT